MRLGQTGGPNANLPFPDRCATGNIVQTVTSDTRTVANTLAFHAVDRIHVGRMFELVLGGRRDNFEAEHHNRATRQRFGRTDIEFAWRAAFVFKPTSTVRTDAAAGTSFNPSAESLALPANDANLAPETASCGWMGSRSRLPAASPRTGT
ncbi:hypothetical protein GCM10010964_32470 [Caldovatus sediminis]|uniref:TonB-dependent receptor-like beta-barrel domain-containing protein n=1 Tax=Caldovatus sediminis TaxID=2041189 RepID=A0A8J3EEL9_9PROT|nr:TonB-dependent receptor [Caldovatus sediminis]GGG42479.1 hypothetical protein GCM10010964_32470 [Caldovatus sediminis]